MGESKFKLCSVFILSLSYFTTSYIHSDGGCTILKTLEQAGFVCASTDLKGLNDNLESILHKRFQQKRPQINLFLKKIRFDGPKNKFGMPSISEKWFKVDISIRFLHLDDLTAFTILKNAFDSLQFVDLSELVIQSRITDFETGAFNGLGNLRRLTLKGIQVNNFKTDTFAPLKMLEWFVMESCINFEYTPPFSVDNLFGSIELPHIRWVKIKNCNLHRTISKSTFSGLTQIEELLLVDDQIECIGPESFDIVFRHLQRLSLAVNRLKSLPDNLFHGVRGQMVAIKLDTNPWHCDCDLEDLRHFVQYSNSEELKEISCKTPENYAGQKIYSLPPLCFDPASPPTQTPRPPWEILFGVQPDDHTDKNSPTIQNDFTTVHCGAINIKKHVQIRNVKKIKLPSIRIRNGFLILYTAHLSKDFFYFGYEQSELKILKCVGNSKGDKVRKMEVKLEPHRMHRLCRIERKHNTITPLECLPFFTNFDQQIDKNAWIMENHKRIFITVLAVVAVIMPFVGFLISMLLAKLFPKFIRGKTLQTKQTKPPIIPRRMRGGIDRFRSIDRSLRRRNTYKQCSQPKKTPPTISETIDNDECAYLSVLDIPPPLPPRNKSIDLPKYSCCNADICECYCEL